MICSHDGSTTCSACQSPKVTKSYLEEALSGSSIDMSNLNLTGNTFEYKDLVTKNTVVITSDGTNTIGSGYATTSVPLNVGAGLYPAVNEVKIHTVNNEKLDMTCPHCFAYGSISTQGDYYSYPGSPAQTRVKCDGCSAMWYVPSTSLPILKEDEFNLDNSESAEDWADENLIKQLIRAVGKSAALRKELREALNSTKWYDCAKCEGGYEDQKCTCK